MMLRFMRMIHSQNWIRLVFGKLMEMAIKLGKSTNPDLHIGICGEHGGDPSSVEFCNKIGLDYVSCSPFVFRSQDWQQHRQQSHRRTTNNKNRNGCRIFVAPIFSSAIPLIFL
ncbi:MAG: putative PEP-binding protein [Lachnospiraceae bacterium]